VAPIASFELPVAFHEVSEHSDSDSETHRPVRRRRQHEGEPEAPAQLQLVETSGQAEVAPVEDELPRRTKPRRRRGGSTPAEPLQLVETASDAPPVQPEAPSSPPQ